MLLFLCLSWYFSFCFFSKQLLGLNSGGILISHGNTIQLKELQKSNLDQFFCKGNYKTLNLLSQLQLFSSKLLKTKLAVNLLQQYMDQYF